MVTRASRRALAILSIGALGLGGRAFAGDGLLDRTLSFDDVTAQRIQASVAEIAQNEKAVEIGDYDQDGDLDAAVAVALSDFGQRRNKLYRNDGGVLLEVSGCPIICGFSVTDVSRSAFFRDCDGDGWLDLFIVNDGNTAGSGGQCKLYISQHPGGAFSHFVEEGQLRLPNGGMLGPSSGGVSFDADGGGGPDIYTGNWPNSTQDRLALNDGSGYFADVTTTHVPSDGDYTRDVATGDLNGDGKLDLLVTNGLAGNNKVYYNDKLDAGSAPGDFSYAGSVQDLGDGGTSHNAMEPGDFDGDGDLDLYWANRVGATGDRILRNDGLDAQDVAQLALIDVLPPYVVSVATRKVTVADLNADDRVDLIVMNDTGRPAILRNTTVLGAMSFVDWTPASAFPSGTVHRGWHAGTLDVDGDDDPDILLGGWNGDHLFENVPPTTLDEDDLTGGAIPGVFGGPAAAVVGRDGDGESDTYALGAVGAPGLIALVLDGPDDYLLELLDGGGATVESIDRGAHGIEEALEHQVGSAGDFGVRVTVLDQTCTDPDGDCENGFSDLTHLLLEWGSCDAPCPDDLTGDGVVGFADLTELLLSWGAVINDYVLEVVARP